MRLATVRLQSDVTTAVRVKDNTLIRLPASDVGSFLQQSGWRSTARSAQGAKLPTDLPRVLSFPAPRRVVCVGLNYRTHIQEMGREVPNHPTLFAKFATSLVGPDDPIILPAASEALDYEAELAVIVGSPVHRAGVRDAIDAIGGFTAFNDVTARDWQRRTTQWLQGKAWDSTTPIGHEVVTLDEVSVDERGAVDLEVRCVIDGVVRQQEWTKDLVFSPGELVSYVSQFTRLEPGDIIATGTPGGVGDAADPPLRLEPGMEIMTEVVGIGRCINRCTTDAELLARSRRDLRE